MLLYRYYRISKPSQEKIASDKIQTYYKRYRRETFWAITLSYSLYYFCRMAFNIVKQPLIDEGIFNESQLGLIGSVMLISYAFGKFANGFIADYCNIKRFMATGLLISLIINVLVAVMGYSQHSLGLSSFFLLICFSLLWAINGWMQSMGSPPAIISLSRWFSLSQRASFFSIMCSTPYLGKALSTILCASVVSYLGWQSGFIFSALAGLLGFFLIVVFVKDTPESVGLPAIHEISGEQESPKEKKSTKEKQKEILLNPAIWLIALSSAFIYISQYAITSWGILFLQNAKKFSLNSAAEIISIAEVFGIVGTVSAGFLSDKVFKGSRIKPVLICGILSLISMAGFLLFQGSYLFNILQVAIFSISIGVLYCIVAGIMALDIVPRKATGAALGIVGISSYLAAGVQDLISGIMIHPAQSDNYDFVAVSYFWLISCALSFLIPILFWKILSPKQN